jgi:hypothetical protein
MESVKTAENLHLFVGQTVRPTLSHTTRFDSQMTAPIILRA